MSGEIITNLKRKRSPAEVIVNQEILDGNNTVADGKPIKSNNDEVNEEPSTSKKRLKTATDDDEDRRMEFLLEALTRVQELELLQEQDELTSDKNGLFDEPQHESTDRIFERNAVEFEAEALGFAVCARETLNFLASEGLSANDPLVQSLRAKLVGTNATSAVQHLKI